MKMDADDSTAPTILVIRLSALGDVANTLPAVAGLRKRMPAARIGWLVEEPSRELVACSGLADEILVFPRKRLGALWSRPWLWPKALAETVRFFKRVRASHYDCALDFQGNLKSGLAGLFSGARDRAGFARGHCREMNWLFNNILAMPASRRMPRAEKHAALAQVVAPELTPAHVPLSGTEDDVKAVEGFLDGLNEADKLFVIHPGTSRFGAFKRWPTERFGKLAQRLSREFGAACVITQGPGEESLAEAVKDASEGTAYVAPPLKIGPLIELLRRADLFVAGDTGPLHVAALLRTPTVAIFGPKDPVIYRPYTETAEVVRKEMECSPCTLRNCDHVSCIRGITVEDVFLGAQRVLEKCEG